MKVKTFLVVAVIVAVILNYTGMWRLIVGTGNTIEIIRITHEIKKHLIHPSGIGDLSFALSIIGIMLTLAYVAIKAK
jgi:hypothetical protein